MRQTPWERSVNVLLGACTAVCVMLVAAPVAAQQPEPEWTVAWGGSWVSYSPFLEADGARLESDIVMKDGIGGSIFVDRWLNRWIGIRADGFYQRARIRLPEQSPTLDVWSVNAGAVVRPLSGMLYPVVPYLFGTGGLISYGLAGPSLQMRNQVMFDAEETEQFLLQWGGGLDILLLDSWEGSTMGVRLEAARMTPWDGPFRFEEESSPGRHGFWRFTVGLSAAVLPH